ncbi:hypothetical protein FGG78_22720 [Thioclava sp. BHET1]|nr:hypothetical protein FGG78_22720 [Thioclava sp. BHET1]
MATRSSTATETIEAISETDLAKEVAALRRELESVAATVGRIGSSGVAEAKAAAKHRIDQGLGLGEDLAAELKREWANAENRVVEQTRANPWRALGIAALGGFALALLMRR